MLDSSTGKPAEGVEVVLQVFHQVGKASVFEPIAEKYVHSVYADVTVLLTLTLHSRTDSDGRCMQLWASDTESKTEEERWKLEAGKIYKVIFQTKPYFERTGRKCFYPWVDVRTSTLSHLTPFLPSFSPFLRERR